MSFENYETSKNSQVNVVLGQMKYLKALSIYMYCKAVYGML